MQLVSHLGLRAQGFPPRPELMQKHHAGTVSVAVSSPSSSRSRVTVPIYTLCQNCKLHQRTGRSGSASNRQGVQCNAKSVPAELILCLAVCPAVYVLCSAL